MCSNKYLESCVSSPYYQTILLLYASENENLISYHYLENKRPASTTPNMDAPDNYQTTYDSKTKIVVLYSLSNAF